MDGTRRNTYTFSFFGGGGKWFPCSIRGLLTRRTPHSIGLLCLITVTVFSVGVCLVLFFRWKLPGTSERVDRKTKVMAVLTCLLYNTQTNTHTHIQPRDFKPPDCSHTHRLDPTLRLAHHSSSDLHPTFCCVYFALYLNSFFFKEEEGTYVFFFSFLFLPGLNFPRSFFFFIFLGRKMCVCVWCMSQSKDEKLRAQVFFFVIIFFFACAFHSTFFYRISFQLKKKKHSWNSGTGIISRELNRSVLDYILFFSSSVYFISTVFF